MKSLIAAIGFLALLLGSCSKPQPPPPPPPAKPLPEITTGTEKGGAVDLEFVIRSMNILPDASVALNAYGGYHGREVGITVILGTEWKARSIGSDVPLVTYQGKVTYRGTVTYRSLGTPSDALLQALDELYGTKLQPAAIRPSTTFTAISLSGEPGYLAKGPTRIKLFCEPDAQGRYAELYTNIDLAKGAVQIREKDPEFRTQIIQALRQK